MKFLFFLLFFDLLTSSRFERGEKLFQANCVACHINGKNRILPEKNLERETLEINGMNTLSAISYQVLNGKNGMPAFGGRLEEEEIEDIAFYILQDPFPLSSSLEKK
jgi:cytochrome c6